MGNGQTADDDSATAGDVDLGTGVHRNTAGDIATCSNALFEPDLDGKMNSGISVGLNLCRTFDARKGEVAAGNGRDRSPDVLSSEITADVCYVDIAFHIPDDQIAADLAKGYLACHVNDPAIAPYAFDRDVSGVAPAFVIANRLLDLWLIATVAGNGGVDIVQMKIATDSAKRDISCLVHDLHVAAGIVYLRVAGCFPNDQVAGNGADGDYADIVHPQIARAGANGHRA
jgi:hypothetical protein